MTMLLMWFVGWNELLIASFSHRSLSVTDAIILASGLHVTRDSAHQAGVGLIFDRVLTELVAKMREMNMDKSELACLKAIVLFNPGTLPTSLIDIFSSLLRANNSYFPSLGELALYVNECYSEMR